MTDPFSRAHACIGTRFRPLGREPKFGLDCIGVAVVAYGINRADIPAYRPGQGSWEQVQTWLLKRLGFQKSDKHERNALVVLSLPGSFHFGVCGERTIIHADMRFKRVAETPLAWASDSDRRFYLPGDC